MTAPRRPCRRPSLSRRRALLPRPGSALLVFLALALGSGGAGAQEIHAFLGRGSSGDEDFASTTGVGVAVAFRVTERIRVQATLDTRESDMDRVGVACVNPLVEWRCISEPIRTENSFSAFTLAVLPSWEPLEALRLSAGPGIVIGNTESANVAESGRQAKIFVKETAHHGLLGVVDAQLRPSRTLPLVLVGQWQARRIHLEACVGDEETYDPFCGTDWWSEVQVGVGLRF